MDRLTGFLRLTRIEHSLMLVIAVLAAELISSGIPALPILALSLAAPILISMGSFAINDYYDIESDRANRRRDRPIVNGSIKKKEAYWIAIICLALGSVCSLFINIDAFAIAVIFAVLAYLYSYKMKDILLLGNIYIAFAMVIPFIYGSYAVSEAPSFTIIIVSLMIFLAGLAREIHGMIRDYKGDSKARNSKNLIYHVGPKRSAELAFILYAESAVISAYLFFFNAPFRHNLVYMVPIAIVDLVLLYVSFGYLNEMKDQGFMKLSGKLALAAMALALLAILASALFYVPLP